MDNARLMSCLSSSSLLPASFFSLQCNQHSQVSSLVFKPLVCMNGWIFIAFIVNATLAYTTELLTNSVPHEEAVHLVMCVDAGNVHAAITVLNSVRRSCSKSTSLIHAHIVTMRDDLQELRQKLACFASSVHGLKWSAYALEDAIDPSTLMFRVRDKDRMGSAELANPLNFARFYLDDILDWKAMNFTKVIYMDTDCLAQACIAPLYKTMLTNSNAPVAAAWRSNRLGSLVNFSHPIWKSLNLSMRGNLSSETTAFNAGVLVVDLARWRQQGILKRTLFWSEANNIAPLYQLGSNPPLVLALAGNVEYFSHTWNFEGFGGFKIATLSSLAEAKVLHWSGRRKPWMRMTWLDSWLAVKRYAQDKWDQNRVHNC